MSDNIFRETVNTSDPLRLSQKEAFSRGRIEKIVNSRIIEEKKKRLFFNYSPPIFNVSGVKLNNLRLLSLTNSRFSPLGHQGLPNPRLTAFLSIISKQFGEVQLTSSNG